MTTTKTDFIEIHGIHRIFLSILQLSNYWFTIKIYIIEDLQMILSVI